jgi:hypothetical protein
MTPDFRTSELVRARALRDMAWRCDDEHQADVFRREADAILEALQPSQHETERAIASRVN